MRHTRMRQIAKAHGEEKNSHIWRKEVGTAPMHKMTKWKKLGLRPVIDPAFMWVRIQYEGDKKVRNYWGIAGTYARKIK